MCFLDVWFVCFCSLTFAGKWLVICFYPMDFTFVCPTEIVDFNSKYEAFKAINTELLFVSVDSKFTHLAWMGTPVNKGGIGQLNFPLVADITKSMSRDYGVLIEDGEDAGVALRGMFTIDPQGVLRASVVHDLPVGRSSEEALRVVKAFQYTEANGVVCPGTWKGEGDKTLVADPEKTAENFGN